MLDTEGVIVSPSAGLPLTGGLSAGSHAKAHAALFYLKSYSAEWPKRFTAALNKGRSPILYFCLNCSSQDSETLQKIKLGARGLWLAFESLHMQTTVSFYFILFWHRCHVLITVHHNTGWTFWLVFLFSILSHPTQRESGFFSLPPDPQQ